MELLKVFVGDGGTTGTSVATMIPGDLLLLDAATYTPLAANTTGLTSKDVVIASCISKNGVNTPVFSTPIKKANIRYISAANDNQSSVTYNGATLAATAEASVTVAIETTPLLVAGQTYTLGVQIKEDLRMGTYNKNTEVLASYVVPSTAVITDSNEDFSYKTEMASILAKGFAANPLTSAGSPYQLIKAVRTVTGGTITGGAYQVVKGSRQVNLTSHGRGAGDIVSLDGGVYFIESTTTNSFIIDTAFQGDTKTLTSSSSFGTGNGGYYSATPTSFNFLFTAVTQTQQNRYDQFRMVDFVVITPKGNETGIFTSSKTGPVLPIGSYRQIRDLEEKAYTNSNPLINYREFPFETFPLNATSGTYYCMIAVSYVSGWGYNMMQSNQAEFLQTAVVAAPFIAEGHFDVDASPVNSVKNFLEVWSAWAGAPTSGSYTFA